MGDRVILLRIRPVPGHDAPPEIRLRRLLKVMLRGFGWQCVTIGHERDEGTDDAHSQRAV